MPAIRRGRHLRYELSGSPAARAGGGRPGQATARVRLFGLVAVAVVALLAGCTSPADGADLARDEAGRLAHALAGNIGYVNRTGQAEWIAAETRLPDTRGGNWQAEIDFLDWSGELAGPGDEVTLDVRVSVTVEASDLDTFGRRGNTSGRATRCFRYRLPLFEQVAYDEIDCPSGAEARQPNRAPGLPADTRARVEAVLAQATPQSLDALVRAAFPEPQVSVDTTVHEGTLVVAVGVTRERECVLAIRTPAGEITYPGFDRVWIEPGEVGCRTGLYTNPPR